MINLNLHALKALNQLPIANREYNLESGFFWVEFENGKSLQLCLNARFDKDNALVEYMPQVSIYDNGYFDGISRDNNSWAADQYGSTEHIEEYLLGQAKLAGLEIII